MTTKTNERGPKQLAVATGLSVMLILIERFFRGSSSESASSTVFTIGDFEVCVKVIGIVALAMLCLLLNLERRFASIFFLLCGVLFQVALSPVLNAVGATILGCWILAMITRTRSPIVRRNLVPAVVLSGLSVFFFAFLGTMTGQDEDADEKWGESTSVAMYEATQALMMNMESHAPKGADAKESQSPLTTSSDESMDQSGELVQKDEEAGTGVREEGPAKHESLTRIWYTIARTSAVTFALLFGYKTLTSYARGAIVQFRLFALKYLSVSRTVSLVCGLGEVGMKLVEDLVRENRTVIVIEKDDKHKYLEAASDLGVILLNDDATQPNVLNQLPINSIEEFFVVCGDDAVNIEVTMALELMVRSKKAEKSPRNVIAQFRRGSMAPPPCYVQIQDSILLNELTRAFSSGSTKSLTPHTFCADRNAVTQLITTQLVAVRPKNQDEVALYVVVGLDDRWEEVVHGLAQLAHFENGLRSRIVVLVDDPKKAAQKLEARYPRFSSQPVYVPVLCNVSFCSIDDNWESTLAGSVQGRTEAVFQEATTDVNQIPDGFVRLRMVCPADDVAARVPADRMIRVRNRNRDQFQTPPAENDTQPRTNPANGDWLEIEGDGEQIRAWITELSEFGLTIQLAEAFGREFATNTRISRLPVTPESSELLGTLLKLSEGSTHRIVKPAMIIAGRNDFQNFQWTELFLRSWTRFRAREGVSPPVSFEEASATVKVRAVSDFSVYVWNSGRRGIETILASGQPGLLMKEGGICSGANTFGAYRDVAGLRVIRSDIRESLVTAIGQSYRYAVDEQKKDQALDQKKAKTGASLERNSSVPLKSDPEEYDGQHSNAMAAEHALVKFAMLLGADFSPQVFRERMESGVKEKFDKELTQRGPHGKSDEEPMQIKPPKLILDLTTKSSTTDELRVSPRQGEQLLMISQAEHNRWSAELLLRNAEWRPIEQGKYEAQNSGKYVRGYSQIHIRQTLCGWNQLKKSSGEQKKDIDQVWYVMYVLAGRLLFFEIWKDHSQGKSNV